MTRSQSVNRRLFALYSKERSRLMRGGMSKSAAALRAYSNTYGAYDRAQKKKRSR